MIEYIAPVIAFVAITKSFWATTGAREGFNGTVAKSMKSRGKTVSTAKLNRMTAIFMLVTTDRRHPESKHHGHDRNHRRPNHRHAAVPDADVCHP